MPKLSICIDGFNLALPKGTGVATYGRNLALALHKLGYTTDILYGLNISCKASAALQEVLFFNELGGNTPHNRPKAFSPKWWKKLLESDRKQPLPIKLSGRVDTRSFSKNLPIHSALYNLDNVFERAARYYRRTKKFMTIHMPDPPQIMHWTYPLPIRLAGAVNVYTIHDLVPLRLPQTTLDDKTYYFRLIKSICESGDSIFTVSEASRRDIIQFFPESKKRVFNTYQTIEPPQKLEEEEFSKEKSEIEALFGLVTDEYFIFFGSLEPKKNIGRLIEAFLSSGARRRLVIVGAMAWKTEGELRFLQRGIDLGRIVHLEYLSHFMLMALVRNARALLFPSIAEGFGLPVLEAFSVGLPVLCSSEGGLAEVAGSAAYIVDAYDITSIINGITFLDKSNDLCAELRLKGQEQYLKFSQEKYCNTLFEIYNYLINLKNS